MENLRKRAIESIIHVIILNIFSLFSVYFIVTNIRSNYLLMFISIIGIIFFINYIKKPYVEKDKDKLAINSWICLISIFFIGVWIGKSVSLPILIGIGFGVSISDVISFTKFGKKTANAKIMDNKNLMIKFIVYGQSFKSKKPVPTFGFGDFLFYTILLSGIYKFSNSTEILFFSALLIFLGVIINALISWFTYQKEWYKGFPATVIPFALILPFIMLNIS